MTAIIIYVLITLQLQYFYENIILFIHTLTINKRYLTRTYC
jgi:hypothetical protein